jgi:hypothetical protein
MYKIHQLNPTYIYCIERIADNVYIPLAVDNTDYKQFKKDLTDGVELQDSTGTAMTADQIKTFLGTLK